MSRRSNGRLARRRRRYRGRGEDACDPWACVNPARFSETSCGEPIWNGDSPCEGIRDRLNDWIR